MVYHFWILSQYNLVDYIFKPTAIFLNYKLNHFNNLITGANVYERCEFATPGKCQLILKKERLMQNVVLFNKTWTSMYLFTEVRDKAVRLVCREQVDVFKD